MRPFNACRDEHAYLNAARVLTFVMGLSGTLAGLLFISPEIRSLMEEYFKVIGMFMGALGGLFILGVTSRKANGWGALVGLFAGVSAMLSAWLMEWANGYIFATIGILTCLVVGQLASLLLPGDHHDLEGLTLYTKHKIQSPPCSKGLTPSSTEMKA
jgi:Na+/proline symporter